MRCRHTHVCDVPSLVNRVAYGMPVGKAGKIFRYPRADATARAEAVAYARQVGVPEAQLDWSE